MLRVHEIKKAYGGHQALDGVTFEIGDRDKVALVGVNGAGKSTLLKIIAGLLPHDEGLIRVTESTEISYLPQDASIRSGRTPLGRDADLVPGADRDPGRARPGRGRDGDRLRGHGSPGPAGHAPGRAAGAVRAARRLPRRGRHRQGAGRPRLRLHRPRQALRGVLRRLADADRAGQDAGPQARPAAARRAHQPPRSEGDRVAGGVPARVPGHDRGRLARSLLHGPGRQPHHRDRGWQGGRLSRQLQLLPGGARAEAEGVRQRLRSPAEVHQAPDGVHQRVPRERRSRGRGQEPRALAGEAAAPGAAARVRPEDHAALRGRPARPGAGHHRRGPDQGVRRPDHHRRPLARPEPGRPGRAGRPERRRQVDAACG